MGRFKKHIRNHIIKNEKLKGEKCKNACKEGGNDGTSSGNQSSYCIPEFITYQE